MAETDIKVIKAGRLIDGTGAAPVEKTTIIIEDNRIKQVGQNVDIPAGAQIIDASNKTVMPGMIDAHMHFWGTRADDTYGEEIARPREVKMVKAVFDAKGFLQAGFTTAKCCGGMNSAFLKKAVKDGFLYKVPRILSAGFPLLPTHGIHDSYMPAEYIDGRTSKIKGQQGGDAAVCDGVDACIQAVRYNLSQGADFMKILGAGPSDFNPEELKAIVQTAAASGKYVTRHSLTAEMAKNAIRAGVKTIDHCVGIDEEAIEMGIKAGVVFVSTLVVMQSLISFGSKAINPHYGPEFGKRAIADMSKSYRIIQKSGGILAIGTDFGGEKLVEKCGGSAVEIELLVKYCDFSPMEAIVAATKNAAVACFMGNDTGTIEPGKFADIIVIDGDPLANIKLLQDKEKIKLVMLEGKVEIER